MKKVVSLLLVLVIALGMCSVGFAATKLVVYSSVAPTGDNTKAGIPASALPADELVIWSFTDADFDYGDGTPVVGLTEKILKNGKVTIKFTSKAGSKCIDEIKFADVTAGAVDLVLVMVDPFVSTGDTDVEGSAYLVFNGKRDTVKYFFETNLANEETPVDADDDYVDTSKGYVAHASGYIKNIEVDLGADVFINAKMFDDKKYYGIADSEISDDDMAMIEKYPSIAEVRNLTTIGLSSNLVEIRGVDGDYYVYDKDMNYLGKSDEKLAYSTKYYLSNEKIETEVDEEGDGAPIDEEADPENDNPSTGK